MRKQIIRWLLPIIVMLVLATALVLSPLISHAAGTASNQSTPPSHQVQPNAYWYGW